MLWQAINPDYALAGFLVGALIGLTGVGGGSLMTPILILLFGITPAKAVGTDLLFAAVTKSVGSLVHSFNHTIDWRIVRRLACGSVPSTALALFILWSLHVTTGGARYLISAVLAGTLFLTAIVLIARNRIFAHYATRLANLDDRSVLLLTVAMGAMLGFLVTFSSVGAGALGVTALLLLYPRISAARIVGSDIAHAVPLTLLAGIGHGAIGSVNWHTLCSLLAGSIPGILVSSLIAPRLPDVHLRYALATVLLVAASRMALDLL